MKAGKMLIRMICMTFMLIMCIVTAGCANKNTSNIPTLEEMVTMSDEEATECLKGLSREELIAAWGEPSGVYSYGLMSNYWTGYYGKKVVVFYYSPLEPEAQGSDSLMAKEVFSIYDVENKCIMPQKLLGEWRVSRIILLPKVWRNDLIISYNYGRTITITENEIVDSLDTSTMGSNDWDYSMHGLYGIEVMKADSAEFAMNYNAYLFDLGLSAEQLEKVTVMGYWDHAAERGLSEDGELEFFLLDDDTMIKQFNSGIYLLKKQNTEAVETLDVEALYGNYKVTEMVSRDIPTSESGATEFFGCSFYWDENGIYDVREQKYILSGAAQLEITDMDKFYENHVVETGLGLTNDRILIWEQGSETVIPINTEEVIVKLRGGWYRMVKTDLLQESTDDVHVLSDSLWKPQQILSYTEGTEEEIKEAARSAEYLLAKWVYISEEDVENFDLQTGSTEEIERTYHMLDGFGNRGDGLAYFF